MNHIFMYSLLTLSIILAASGATVNKALKVNSAIKVCWRMQITVLAQIPPFIYEIKTQRERVKGMFTEHVHLPILGGLCLALYFFLWVMSLDVTSVAHSVLIANSVPIIIVLGNLVLCRKVKAGDMIGVGVGLIGKLIISSDMESGNSTLIGDLIATTCAFCNAAYWLVGNEALKNKNLPLWSYMITLNATACVVGFIISGMTFGYTSFFGWITDERLPYVIWLGLGPGLITHVSNNYLLKFLGPLIVTSFANLTPFVAIMIAWYFGFQDAPHLILWIGGIVVLAGNMIISLYKSDEKPIEVIESVVADFIDSEAIASIYNYRSSKLTNKFRSCISSVPINEDFESCQITKHLEPEVIEFQV